MIRRRRLTNPRRYMLAYEAHEPEARAAFALYREYCGGNPPPRVPGMDTVIRLAWRIECGRSVEEAAAREYLYRWGLAIKPADQAMLPHNTTVSPAASIFGAPHAIWM